jgi:SET domain-containing protein 6
MTDYSKNTGEFFQWVKSVFSFVSPKFEVADLRKFSQGRGLIATQDISKDEVLFEISRDVILNIDTASITSLREENKNILLSLNQWQALIICVAYEWYLGNESKLFNYFNVLPLKSSDFNSLMFWNDQELQYLKPSGVLNRIGREQAEEMYALLITDIIPTRLLCPELAEFLTLEKFHIVASLIMSYSFDVDHPEEVDDDYDDKKIDSEEEVDENIENVEHDDDNDDNDNNDNDKDEDEDDNQHQNEEPLFDDHVSDDTYLKSMVPLADTLNSNTTFYNAVLKYEKTKLVMIAEKDIAKNEQIFNIYGEMPNSEILRKYGYVELPSSKFEFAEITLPSIKTYFQNLYELKLKFLKSFQIEKLLDVIFENIETSEYLEEELTEELESGVIADKYEIYANGEILPELILLLSILTSFCQTAESDEKWFKKMVRSIDRKPSLDLLAVINRTILKCHQLLENKSIITKSTLNNLNEIIKLRISEYPSDIIAGTFKLPHAYEFFDKQKLSNIVLFNEVQCLKDAIDGKFPPKEENGTPRFTTIDDEKFLKNLLKRKIEEQDSKAGKRQKKQT